MKKNCALITGSANGLGKELALVFTKNGFNTVLSDIDKDNLEIIKNEILKNNVECDLVVGDLKSDKVIKKLEGLSREKNVNLLINNAGLHCPYLSFEKISDKKIEEILITNLIAPIKLSKRIYNIFLEQGSGTIININSLLGIKHHRLRTVYSASKWGLRGFSDSLKIEANENNIRVIDIYPSRIKTRPEFEEGMDPKFVAQKIYESFKNANNDKIEINRRKNDD